MNFLSKNNNKLQKISANNAIYHLFIYTRNIVHSIPFETLYKCPMYVLLFISYVNKVICVIYLAVVVVLQVLCLFLKPTLFLLARHNHQNMLIPPVAYVSGNLYIINWTLCMLKYTLCCTLVKCIKNSWYYRYIIIPSW